jgi:glycosyltransferase involved in cell wall biosynthesis
MPKFSIITVNLNNSIGLEKTILSVRSQDFRDFEHIVIDGSSSDDSVGIIKKYSDGIFYWISESDRGIYDAMNKGIKAANGDYCFFLNSGDSLFQGNTLSKVNNSIFDLEIYYCDVMLVYEQNRKLIKIHPEDNLLFYLSYEMICHQGILFRTDILRRMNAFSLKYRFCSDYEVLIKMIIDPKIRFKKINETLSDFDMQGLSNHSENGNKIHLEKLAIWNENISQSLNDAIINLSEFSRVQNSFWYHFRKTRQILFNRLNSFFRRKLL